MTHQGKVAIVTGAGGEIGAALARGLAEAGAHVALCDINHSAADSVARSLCQDNLVAHAFALDVTSKSVWKTTVDDIVNTLGPPDILVNCAGLFSKSEAGITGVSETEWRALHDANLHGAFFGIQTVIETMRTRSGVIVNIGSVVGYFGARSGVAYGTSKAAIRGLTQQSAAACIAEGLDIRINALHPGYILTNSALGSSIERLGSREAAEASFATRSPKRRCLGPDALIDPLLFLTSDASRYMHGTELLVDDGLSTQMPGAKF